MLSCVGRGLYEELIALPKESYHMYNKIRGTSKRRSWLHPGWRAFVEKTTALILRPGEQINLYQR
jgi:hypothetical protein